VAAVVLHADRPDTTPDELEAWAAERLASYKRPRRIFVLDHLPVSATFKPRKGELRERLLSLEHGDR
jgi:long-chain acyl-CoA synthetase